MHEVSMDGLSTMASTCNKGNVVDAVDMHDPYILVVEGILTGSVV